MTKLPTLYKRTTTGKIEQWTIWVEVSGFACFGDSLQPYDIVTEYGHVDGKLQQARETVSQGKNLGKKNATNTKQQAESQAWSEWTKKKERNGYVDSLERAQAGENDQEGGIAPMLAQAFSKHGDKLEYPLWVQPKLDGIRCIAVVGADGSVTLWSRTRKQFVSIPHIEKAVAALNLAPGTILDGELYNHDLKNDFEVIVSAVRKEMPAPAELAKKIQYHIYDIPRHPVGQGAVFKYRALAIQNISTKAPFTEGCLHPVETKEISSIEDLIEYFEDCRKRGYEGAMVRASDGEYEEGKRSYHLQKMKEFDEAEYSIVGVEEGVGKMAGLAIFVCKTADGTEFKAKLEGSLENLRKYLKDESTWKGKKLTVQYQGITGKSKVPRFPVGKAVRDYE